MQIPTEWLTHALTDIEVAALGEVRGRITRKNRPFVAALLAFKAQLRAGDALWYFDSPQEAWANERGCRGLAIVRGGEVIDTLVLMEN